MIAILCTLCAFGLPLTQDAKPVPKKPSQKHNDKWPALKSVRKSITRDQIPNLASKDTAKAAAARKSILRYGAGTCPVLLAAMTPRQRAPVFAACAGLLDELVEPKHVWALLAAYKGKNPRRDQWIVAKAASFKLPATKQFFVRASKDKNKAVAEKAWFALAEFGDVRALPFLHELALGSWKERNYEVRSALPHLHGKAATDWLMAKLLTKDSHEKIATLRLLAGAGTKAAVPAIGTLLNSSEHQLRAEAVNALRGIVDGDPPFRNLSVFQAIGEVKKWKRRIGR